MALTAQDKQAVQAMVQAELQPLADLLGKIEARLGALGAELEAIRQVLPRLAPVVDIKPVELAVAQIPSAEAVAGHVLATLREQLPRLFEERAGEQEPVGMASRWYWLVERDSTVHLAGSGTVRLSKGQVVDARYHRVVEYRAQNAVMRPLLASELDSYGISEER